MNHSIRYIALLLLACFGSQARGQAYSELPRAEYYLARELYGAGAHLTALEGFTTAYDRGRKVGNSRWVDSIPPLVMAGECLYQQGKISQALQQYDAALTLLLQNPAWIEQLDLVIEQIPTQEFGNGVNWFAQPTSASILAIPEAIQLAVDPLAAQVNQQGGVIAPVSLVTRLDAAEVFYTLAIALSRRTELLGPLAEHSPLSAPLSGLFSQRRSHPVPWVTASWQVLRGMSLLTSERTAAEAVGELRSNILIGGSHHYLSPIALTALAKVELNRGNFAGAIQNLQVANLLAAQFEQHDTLAESTHLLSMSCAAGKRTEMVEPLSSLAQWAAKRSTLTRATALGGAARVLANNGDVARGSKVATQARNVLIGREVVLPRHQAQLAYTNAMLAYSADRSTTGLQSLRDALAAMQGSADGGAVVPEVFQAQLTLDLLAKGNLTKQTALSVLADLMEEPSNVSWQVGPLETLARITTASMPAYERLLELSYEAGTRDEALLRLIDRLQRQRLYESLPLGGRLFSWRNAFLADPKRLSQVNRQSVANVSQARPQLKQALQEITGLKAQLKAQPIPLDERKVANNARKQFNSLASAASSHESQLMAVSLMHQPLARFLPNEFAADILREQLGETDCLVTFAFAGRGLIGVAATRDDIHVWSMANVGSLPAQIASLINQIGVRRLQGRPLPSAVTAANASWRTAASKIGEAIFSKQARAMLSQKERIVIAPHSSLWYLPFELLPLDAAQGPPIIVDKTVCYIPTASSLGHALAGPVKLERTLGTFNTFFALDSDENLEAAQRVVAALPQTAAIPLDQKISSASASWLRHSTDCLWIGSTTQSAGFDTVLLPLGGSRQATVGSWLESPGLAPGYLVAPGIETSANRAELGSGDDIFLSACAIAMSGTRSAVISRWPAGGQSTASLLTRYLEELPMQRPSSALRTAVLALWAESFLVDDEPSLVPAAKEGQTLTPGSHPALWAGYMAIGDFAEAK